MPTFYIRGPLHPDLFDGETPVMQAVVADLFRVDLTWLVGSVDGDFFRGRAEVTVLARNEREAQFVAEVLTQNRIGDCGGGVLVEDVCVLDVYPTDEQIADFVRRVSIDGSLQPQAAA